MQTKKTADMMKAKMKSLVEECRKINSKVK